MFLSLRRYNSGGAALSALGLVLEGCGSNANVSLAADGRVLGSYGHSTLEGVEVISLADNSFLVAACGKP